jgi:hypothetical protein
MTGISFESPAGTIEAARSSSIALKAWRKANFLSTSVPSTAAGSGMPQCAVSGWAKTPLEVVPK